MYQAYSLLTVKSLDDAERTLEGIATTPQPDRAEDVIDPLGAEFSLPIPLLWQHDAKQPIGEVTHATVSADGIHIRAKLAQVTTPGALQARLDDAYHSIKAGLVRGLSVGLKPREVQPIKGSYGLRILKWWWAELSAVTIPQNTQATILTIKAADTGLPVPASGSIALLHPAGQPMTISEQIIAVENTRAAKVARMTDLLTKAGDANRTTEPAEATEYDGLSEIVKNLDADLVRLRTLEELNKAAAVPIKPVTTTKDAGLLRAGMPITVKSNVPSGTGFVRYAQSLLVTKGNIMLAAEYAKRWEDSTPEVGLVLKAAVAAGTTTDAVWAGPLAPMKPLADEFMALLRPATILGKIPGFKQVPFNVSMPIQTGGGTYKWVGQNAPKPVGTLAFGTLTLGITKCAGIIVITDELARNSTPAAESVIRADMINGIAYFLDVEFTDPAKAPVAGVAPGSITNGVTPITTAGTTPANARTDIQALINAMTAAGISTVGAVLLMSETNAAALGSALNPLGQPLFGDLTVSGGTAMGIKVVPSQAVGNNVILVAPPTVLYADDGGVTIDVSTEASVQMDNAPIAPDATTVMTSFWQNNLVGLRAERYINWKRGRTGGVQYTVATYTA
jgi:HK97 family phage major capsid protein/HK97 family phage prohead protease